MIVPNSSISAEKLSPLQKIITDDKKTWISNYSWRPSKLFEGADMLLTIIITANTSEKQTYSSIYHKWYSDFRDMLFENIKYYNATKIAIEGSIPKLPSKLYISVLNKMQQNSDSKTVLNYHKDSPTQYYFYYFRAVQYWVKILEEEPIYLDNGIQTTTGEMKPIYVKNDEVKYILISLLSSSLFFIYYATWASCQVINHRDFMLPFDLDTLSKQHTKELVVLGKQLQKSYQSNSHSVERTYSKKGRNFTMLKQHFYIKYSKSIIDQIDAALAQHYGFTDEELDYIINYDIKYRMGLNNDNADNED
jgi:hypothetical protein